MALTELQAGATASPRMERKPASSSAALIRQWLDELDAVLRSSGIEAASRLALQALAEGVEHPLLLNLAGLAHYDAGQFDQAVELLKRARKLAPKDPHVLNSLGMSLMALGRDSDALEIYNDALRADAHVAAIHFNRGVLLERLLDLNAARTAFERAAQLDQNYVEPIAGLAWLDAQSGDPASALARAERALRLSPTNLLARMASASADLQNGNLDSAEARLFELSRDSGLTRINRAIVLGLIGDLADARGQTPQAFTAYERSNSELKVLNAARFATDPAGNSLGQVRQLIHWFGAANQELWQAAPAVRPRAGDPKAHVFLVGFPRSGTTLLENVLAAHPDVVSLEERDCLEQVAADYLASAQGVQRLALIDGGQAHRARTAYWTMIRKLGVEPRGRVFIDKMPLASALLPAVSKLFPDARILFAVRDPRDVVLSCFRRRFGMNAAMYQLLTLEGAAQFYEAVMQLSEIYRRVLPLPQHIVRYESLVDNLEGTARSVCEFIGLEWDEAMRDFATTARTRSISTPSAAQVARGLNRDGQGVWRRYRDQMAPVLPLLQPWVECFGYEPS